MSTIDGGQERWPVYMRLKPRTTNSGVSSFITTVPHAGCSITSRNPAKRVRGTSTTETIITTPPRDGGMTRFTNPESFEFSALFNETARQQEVYERTLLPLVTNVLQGRDSVFFAIGSSGSGKTHTMLGPPTIHNENTLANEPGIVHLAIDTIFKSLEGQLASFDKVERACDRQWNRESCGGTLATMFLQDTNRLSSLTRDKENDPLNMNHKVDMGANSRYQYAIYISMVEIYNEKIYDLFEMIPTTPTTPTTTPTKSTFPPPSPTKRPTQMRKSISIKSDPDHPGKVCLRDQRKIYVSGREQAYGIIEQGRRNRSAQWTQTNASSSRSHAFIMIEIKKISKTGRGHVASSQLSIVDLAGTEKNKLAQTRGDRFVESNAINRSLMILGQCLEQQRSISAGVNMNGGQRRIPTRANTTPATTPTTTPKCDQTGFRSSVLTRLLLSNAFSPSLRQMTAVMVNIDPYGDYNLALQILRYSALARHVSVKQEPESSDGDKDRDGEMMTSPTRISREATPRGLREITPNRVPREMTTTISQTSTRLRDKPRLIIRPILPPPSQYAPKTSEITIGTPEREQALRDEIVELKARCLRIEMETREELWGKMERQFEYMRDKYETLVEDETASEQSLANQKLDLLCRQKDQEIASLQKIMERLEIDKNGLTRDLIEMANYREEVGLMRANVKKLASEKDQEINSLQTSIKMLTEENINLKKTKTMLSAEIVNKDQEIALLQTSVKELTYNKDQEILRLNAIIQTLNDGKDQEIAQRQATIHQLQNNTESLNVTTPTHERLEIPENKDQVTLLRTIQTLTNDNTSLQKRVVALQQRTKYRRKSNKRPIPVTQRH